MAPRQHPSPPGTRMCPSWGQAQGGTDPEEDPKPVAGHPMPRRSSEQGHPWRSHWWVSGDGHCPAQPSPGETPAPSAGPRGCAGSPGAVPGKPCCEGRLCSWQPFRGDKSGSGSAALRTRCQRDKSSVRLRKASRADPSRACAWSPSGALTPTSATPVPRSFLIPRETLCFFFLLSFLGCVSRRSLPIRISAFRSRRGKGIKEHGWPQNKYAQAGPRCGFSRN